MQKQSFVVEMRFHHIWVARDLKKKRDSAEEELTIASEVMHFFFTNQ